MKVRLPLLYLTALFVVATVLAAITRPTVDEPAPAAASAIGELPDLTGTWVGAWTDTVFFVSGAMTFDVVQDGASFTGTGTINVDQIQPGAGDLAGTGSGTLSLGELSGTFSAAQLGTGTVTITANPGAGDASASAQGSGSVTGGLFEFGPFEFEGTTTSVGMAGRFSFTNKGAGGGVAALTKKSTPTETESWGGLKDRHQPR